MANRQTKVSSTRKATKVKTKSQVVSSKVDEDRVARLVKMYYNDQDQRNERYNRFINTSSYHSKPAKKAKTPKPHKKGYSAAERKAYYMGLGAGMCGVKADSDKAVDLIDSRQGRGQRKDLCASAKAGLFEGYKHRNDMPPFGKDGWLQKRSKKRK